MLAAAAVLTTATPTSQVQKSSERQYPPTGRQSPPRGCIAKLAACGYPDAGTNDGAHGALRPVSGEVTLDRPGEVYENVNITGDIVVRADNVRINNVIVTCKCGGQGHGIFIVPGVNGTTIENSILRGAGRTPESALGDGVLNAGGNRNTTARRLYIYNSGSTAWNGPGRISDSYMIVDTFVPGAHAETIYEGGGDGGIQATHDTLLNNQPQTAVVDNGSDYGPAAHDTIQDSILAGGGNMIYGGAGVGYRRPVDGPHILNNRFVRAPYGGFFRAGGSAGLGAAIDAHTIDWNGNYWDDNLTAVRM